MNTKHCGNAINEVHTLTWERINIMLYKSVLLESGILMNSLSQEGHLKPHKKTWQNIFLYRSFVLDSIAFPFLLLFVWFISIKINHQQVQPWFHPSGLCCSLLLVKHQIGSCIQSRRTRQLLHTLTSSLRMMISILRGDQDSVCSDINESSCITSLWSQKLRSFPGASLEHQRLENDS